MNAYSQNHTAAAQAATAVPRSRRRMGILTLLAIGTMINYLDRTVLGIAAPSLTSELGIDAAVMGIVFSAFAWTYALAQIPGGLFLDRFGNKVTYFLSLTLWSLFTLFHGMAIGLKTLLLCRFGLGVSEAPCFPVNSRVVSAWSRSRRGPRQRQSIPSGSTSGWPASHRCCSGLWAVFGWRALFISVGAVGVLFALVWWRCYREPHEDKRLSQQGARAYCQRRRSGDGERPADGFQLAAGASTAGETADSGRQHRPVCRQYGAGVFPHLVPDLSGHRAAYAVVEGGNLRHSAVPCRCRRRDVRRLGSPTNC